MNTEQIEEVLRRAPAPQPPEGLREQLLASAPRRGGRESAATLETGLGAWLRRWWPVLLPGAACAAMTLVLVTQQLEISDLRASVQGLTPKPDPTQALPAAVSTGSEAAQNSAQAAETAEIARLKEQVGKLKEQLSGLLVLQAENKRLLAETRRNAANSLSSEETAALADAKARAELIRCINNLKQLGLAARIWASDHNKLTPPAVTDMAQEMSTPLVLHCPADTTHPEAKTWDSFTADNCSYEYLAPGAGFNEPDRIEFRCPIHGSMTLCDGSVQSGFAKLHPDWIIEKDGKLYYNKTALPAK
jgi:hypothetical protein